MRDVQRELTGDYKCEVSADAPLFHTDIRTAHMLVADIPEDGPVLTTEVHKVAPGAKIKANCTSPGAYPHVNITWFINDVEIHPGAGIRIHETVKRFDAMPGLESLHSMLSLSATQDLFKDGKLKLRCLATMFTLYRRTEELDLQEDTPLLALIMVPTTHSNEGISNHAVRHLFSGTTLLLPILVAVCTFAQR